LISSGGLFHQEHEIIAIKDEISKKKDLYLKKLTHYGENGIRVDSSYSPYHLLQDLGKTVISFEGHCISLAKRRMLAISQALTVAINGLMLKLNLLIKEQIPYQIANRWLENGFLIVFEGLLSVVGNERSMLEDTISAVEALRSYHVRILSNSSSLSGDDHLHQTSEVS
jgi:hypothetical protein